MVYEGHLYKGRLLGVFCFVGLFSTVFIRDSFSTDFTVSLINHIGCNKKQKAIRAPSRCNLMCECENDNFSITLSARWV